MTITGGLLFCEGETDKQPLQSLLYDLKRQPTLVPTGGKRGMWAFIKGYRERSETVGRFMVFRDRDFDMEPPVDPGLIPFEGTNDNVFLSHRACIENYLLDPDLVHAFWDEKSKGKDWKYGASPGRDAISAWIRTAAQELKYYQAVRWALAQLLQPDRLETTWRKGSGDLPRSLEENPCLEEVQRMLLNFQKQADGVNLDRFKVLYASFLDRFEAPGFFDEKQYMVWFHGKDLAKQMNRTEVKYGNGFPFPKYFANDWHGKQNFTRFADLKQLTAEIETHFA